MNDKKHLTEEGLIRIMSIRVKMNKKNINNFIRWSFNRYRCSNSAFIK